MNDVQFTPDTSRLATAGRDGRLVVWDLSELNDVRNRPVESACAVTGRSLSREEWAGYVSGLEYRETCPE